MMHTTRFTQVILAGTLALATVSVGGLAHAPSAAAAQAPKLLNPPAPVFALPANVVGKPAGSGFSTYRSTQPHVVTYSWEVWPTGFTGQVADATYGVTIYPSAAAATSSVNALRQYRDQPYHVRFPLLPNESFFNGGGETEAANMPWRNLELSASIYDQLKPGPRYETWLQTTMRLLYARAQTYAAHPGQPSAQTQTQTQPVRPSASHRLTAHTVLATITGVHKQTDLCQTVVDLLSSDYHQYRLGLETAQATWARANTAYLACVVSTQDLETYTAKLPQWIKNNSAVHELLQAAQGVVLSGIVYATAIYQDMLGNGSAGDVTTAGQKGDRAYFRYQSAEYALRAAYGLLPKGGHD